LVCTSISSKMLGAITSLLLVGLAVSGPSLTLRKHYGNGPTFPVLNTMSLHGHKWHGENFRVHDDLSSYKIDGDFKWIFYEHANYNGKSFTAKGPKGWTGVPGGFNDIVSSVKVVEDSPAAKCIKNGWDYWGNDIKSFGNIPNVDACVDKCRETNGCKSITYYKKTCWVKRTEFGQKLQTKAGCQSANLSCAKPAACPAGKREVNKRCVACTGVQYCAGGAGVGAKPCPAGKLCSGGKANNCPAKKVCSGGKANACPAKKLCSGGKANACPAKKVCSGGEAKACPAKKVCSGGEAKACPANKVCAGGEAKACFGGSTSAAGASACTKKVTLTCDASSCKCP